MAIYHLSMKIISRNSGYSAVASAAYRSGSLMLDERTGLTHDYTRKSGVAEAVILTPATAPAWCTNRAELWNAGRTHNLRGKLNSPSPANYRRMPHGKPFSPLSEKTLSVRA